MVDTSDQTVASEATNTKEFDYGAFEQKLARPKSDTQSDQTEAPEPSRSDADKAESASASEADLQVQHSESEPVKQPKKRSDAADAIPRYQEKVKEAWNEVARLKAEIETMSRPKPVAKEEPAQEAISTEPVEPQEPDDDDFSADQSKEWSAANKKYKADHAKWRTEHNSWLRKEAVREAEQAFEKKHQATQSKTKEEEEVRVFDEEVKKYSTAEKITSEEYYQTAGEIVPILKENPLMNALLQDELGMIYALGKNPSEAERISKLRPTDMAEALVVLKNSLKSKYPGPRKISQASEPAMEIGTNRNMVNAVDAAFEAGDSARGFLEMDKKLQAERRKRFAS